MDPANFRECLREAALDEAEGADIMMVKPAGAYLDIIRALKDSTTLPISAYQVSGEYSMLKAAAAAGYLNEKDAVLESLISIKRAGADLTLTYFAVDAAKWLQEAWGLGAAWNGISDFVEAEGGAIWVNLSLVILQEMSSSMADHSRSYTSMIDTLFNTFVYF